jgi:hypothetical protein
MRTGEDEHRIQGGFRMRLAILLLVLTSSLAAQTLPDALTPQPDVLSGNSMHRAEDSAFGFLFSAPIGVATRPWIGLAAGEAAGIINESRYGSNFNFGHLAFITGGALAGYGLARWEKHLDRKRWDLPRQ